MGDVARTEAEDAAELLGLMRGFVVAKTVHVIATLGVADQLAEGPLPVDRLAERVQAHPDALYRMLRALSSVGLFQELPGRSFALTRLGGRLRADVPGSLKNWFITNGGLIFEAFTGAGHSARTGAPAFDHVFGASFFDYLREHPAESVTFSSAMREYTGQANVSLLASYDFATARRVVDVGGGDGTLIAGVLAAHPNASGVVFDHPHVVERARASRDIAALGDRVEIVGGDFFESVPSGGDLYLLTWILHDWDDERATTILRSCRRAMPEGARLVVAESIVPEGDEAHFSKFGDIVMMVLFGSRERTEAEYRRLLAGAGFRVTRVVPTSSQRSLIEAVPG